MPTLIESEIHILIPDQSMDDQKRLAGELAGQRGWSVAEITAENDLLVEEHERIGFKPPSERKRIDALLEEIHSFLYPDGQPQGA